VPRQRLVSSDESVLGTVNASLSPGIPPLRAVHEIFDGVSRLLSGVPELDPYGSRDRESYLGLYNGGFGSAVPRWPDGDGPRIFFYLTDEYRHIELALDGLAGGPARCWGYLRTANPALREKYLGSRLLLSDEPVELNAGVAASDFCVCHGNVGTVMSILRHGKPMLLLPIQLEHFLLAAKLRALGIADVVHPDRQPIDIGGALSRSLANRSLAESARAFAAAHGGHSIDTIAQRAASRIEALAQTQGASL
jgi:UDP:flavonoid glycosyltransferase YjiC (YdhE family)